MGRAGALVLTLCPPQPSPGDESLPSDTRLVSVQNKPWRRETQPQGGTYAAGGPPWGRPAEGSLRPYPVAVQWALSPVYAPSLRRQAQEQVTRAGGALLTELSAP